MKFQSPDGTDLPPTLDGADMRRRAFVNLYPNPTNRVLRIESAQAWKKVEIIDVLGRNVFTQTQAAEQLDLYDLPKGVYLVKVHFAEGVVVKRVVRE